MGLYKAMFAYKGWVFTLSYLQSEIEKNFSEDVSEAPHDV